MKIMISEGSFWLELDGKDVEREVFIRFANNSIRKWIGERMFLDAMLREWVKNIWDHVEDKRGSLVLERLPDGRIRFEASDSWTKSFDFKYCQTHSRLAGSGVNGGTGLNSIVASAEWLEIDELKIDSSCGFRYSGIYTPRALKEKQI